MANSRQDGVLTASEIGDRKISRLQISGIYQEILGDLGTGAHIMIYGAAGQGKSTFALALAKNLDLNGARVLYVSAEEFESNSLVDKINRLSLDQSNVHITNSLNGVRLSAYDVVFIDSVQAANITIEHQKSLKEKAKHLTVFFVVHATKGGTYKGGSDWGHYVDVIMTFEKGLATTTKNRYAPTSSWTISFDQLKK